MTEIPSVTLNNGIKMPQLGLGVFRMPQEETAQNVRTALAAGYRLIDTAAAYQNEEGVGEGIRTGDIPREELFITTKLWNPQQGYDTTLKAFEMSMEKLGLEYLDLYLIHWPRPMHGKATETWKAFEKLYKDGRIKAIGVSNFTPEHLDKLLSETEVVPAVNQVELHPLFTQNELRKYALEHGIQIESWYPLGGQHNKEDLLGLPLLAEIAQKYGKTPAQVVLRWHTQLGLVVIPKSSNAERIKQNADIFDFELSQDEVNAVSALDTGKRLGGDPNTLE